MRFKKKFERWRSRRLAGAAAKEIGAAINSGFDIEAVAIAALESSSGLTRLPGETLYGLCGRSWGVTAAQAERMVNLMSGAGYSPEDAAMEVLHHGVR